MTNQGASVFNVLQDRQDQDIYYFFEVYRDEAALEAHRAAPHYAVWRAAATLWTDPLRRRAAKASSLRRAVMGKTLTGA